MSSNDRLMADRLGLTVRRVQQLADDGVLSRSPDTNEFEIEENARAHRTFINRDIQGICDAIEAAAAAIDCDLDELRQATTSEQRMKLAREVGPHIGKLDNLLRLSIAMERPGSRQLCSEHNDMVLGRVIGEYLALIDLRIADDSTELVP